MPNRLATETSPYLLQHADNPVDWHPWGEEALQRARNEGRPILLSIGYAACHWCHVMAHESFENTETAALMNALFVNVKVDREERPDLDSIYMHAVQAMTGHGGWPLTVFLTPDGIPFHGGTYYPPVDRHGMPSFSRVLRAVTSAWSTEPDRIARVTGAVQAMYRDLQSSGSDPMEPSPAVLQSAFAILAHNYDKRHGGFGGAPKFPPTMVLEFLLTHWRRTGDAQALHMAHHTFLCMARGGIYDQVGGGFARYSVDSEWLVPHFEKMLYDNALLIRLGAQLYQATGDSEVRRTVEETIAWAEREMLSPEGLFFSSLDADSEGEEGKYYIWSAAGFDAALGNDAHLMREYFGVTEGGNFEGHNILRRSGSDQEFAARVGVAEGELREVVRRSREWLLAARGQRIRPGVDDKAIVSWNALMARALMDCGSAFADVRYSDMGVRCASFLFDRMTARREVPGVGEVLTVCRTFSRGEPRITGYLEDYAALGLAATATYQVSFDEVWLSRAQELTRSCVSLFAEDGGTSGSRYFDTSILSEELITRPRDVADNATPSGASLVAELLRLTGEYTGDNAMLLQSERVVASLVRQVSSHPLAFGAMLCNVAAVVHGSLQVALIGDSYGSTELAPWLREVRSRYLPSLVLGGCAGESSLPLLKGKEALSGRVTGYLCRRYLCEAPARTPEELGSQIDAVFQSWGT